MARLMNSLRPAFAGAAPVKGMVKRGGALFRSTSGNSQIF